jgi:hypothetical protein
MSVAISQLMKNFNSTGLGLFDISIEKIHEPMH